MSPPRRAPEVLDIVESGVCSMCGEIEPLEPSGVLIPHQRKDILAMLDRGVFR